MGVAVYRFVIIVFGCVLLACESKPVEYVAGFQALHVVDSTRVYKPLTDPNDSLHYRPILIELWYPATSMNPGKTALTFKDLLVDVERQLQHANDQVESVGYSDQLLDYFCRALSCDSPESLGATVTASYRDAPRVDGALPLLIYFAGINGAGFENYQLMERLAHAGFVVASIQSAGRYPGSMSTQIEDAQEQANDAAFAIQVLAKRIPLRSKIGVMGYSWGGVAAALFTKARSDVQLIISMDGSETNGDDRLDPTVTHYIYVGRQPERALGGNRFRFLGTHEDLTCLPMLGRRSAEKSSYPVLASWLVNLAAAMLIEEPAHFLEPQNNKIQRVK